MAIHIDDLSYRKDLFALAEAMQYAFNREPESDYDKQNKRYWIGQVLATSKLEISKLIKETKSKHAKDLEESPLLLGLLDMYVAACETDDKDQLKQIYLAYQDLQKGLPFSSNKKAYVEAGCGLTTGLFGQDEDKIFLFYPIHLYSSYNENGGRSDDHRGGYLYPVHNLTIDELKELEEINPKLFESGRVDKAYSAMQKEQPQPGSN